MNERIVNCVGCVLDEQMKSDKSESNAKRASARDSDTLLKQSFRVGFTRAWSTAQPIRAGLQHAKS
jgi:hypothetical protein